jgi:hypothetical protein
MAITYLSGGRIQGSSAVEKTATYSTTFGSTSGWSSNDTHVFIDTGNNMLEFELDDDGTDEFINYDMGAGNISNTEWVLRCELTFTTFNAQTNDNNNILLIGCYDNASPSGITASGDALSWGWYMRGTTSTDGHDTKLRSINGGSESETEGNNNPFSSSTATNTPFYIELKRVSADSLEFRCFSDSSYSTQVGSTIIRATSSSVTALRYLTINLFCQGTVQGGGYKGYIQNLKFYNATTTATEAEKATITDVPTGTRFEETDTRKIFRRKSALTSEDDLSTDKGWTSNTSDWSYNATNDSVDLATIRRTPTSQEIYIDLQDADYLNGSNLSDTAWIVRLGKIVHNSLPSGGGVTCSVMISKLVQDSGTNQYSLNLQGHFPTNNLFWRLRVNSNTNNEGNSSSVSVFSSSTAPSTSTSYLWEFKRDGNVFSITAYAESDTTYSSPLETETATVSGLTALRYILITNDSEGENNSHVADMELKGGIKIYNGVTSTDDVWTEKGTA